MQMKIEVPKYNGKDNLVMLLIVFPISIIINTLFFGAAYWKNWQFFLYATATTSIFFIFYFIICGWIAVSLKNHCPAEHQVLQRLSFTIAIFLLMTGVFMYLLLRGYEAVGFFGAKFNETAFVWSYFAMGITNIFITFTMEGISRYKDWKANLIETEKINASYRQSQLNGLKSQVNPHFLFNSLNSLSSLIQEDEQQAEKFLDEMSKVYRYMLRTDDVQFATLETELKFLSSYLHLLTTRFGTGLQVKLQVDKNDYHKLLAPLTLQVMVENCFTQNVISKSSPLLIEITTEKNSLILKNNVQPKTVTESLDFEAGLDNLIKKYELLGKPLTINDDDKNYRVVQIPLIENEQEVKA